MSQFNSVLDLFVLNVSRYPEKTAAMVKRGGAYQDVSWTQMDREARSIARGLVTLGLEPGERVCLICQTRLEWVLSDLGVLFAGGVTVPIYASSLADECQFIAEDSDAVVVFAEDAEQVEKLRAERARLPNVRKVIQIEGEVAGSNDWVITLAELEEMGGATPGEAPEAADRVLEERRQGLTPDSILTIIYTSGTTGRPKGVVTTHAAMLYEADAVVQVDVIRPTDIQLVFLPLAHVFAKLLEIGWLSTRHVLAFAESMQTIKENLKEVRPTLMAGVPRVFEKLYTAIAQKAVVDGRLKARLFNEAAALSELNGRAENRGESLGFADALKFKVLRKLVFSKIASGLRDNLGGRMRLMVSGGAPLSSKVNWFFRDAGLTILEGYGLTETAAGAFINRPGAVRIGTVGQALPGTECRIAEDGEILLRGPGIMREYWKRPEATAEVLKDGWFHTGDIGELDAAGYLRITDRKKDIIITAGGKNVAPQNIENLLKTHPLISQVVIHGDRRKYLTALITLDPDSLRELARSVRLGNGSYATLTQRPEVRARVQEIVNAFNRRLGRHETLKKFKILEHDFSQESGELTPSLKVKRKVISKRYRRIFDGFYEET